MASAESLGTVEVKVKDGPTWRAWFLLLGFTLGSGVANVIHARMSAKTSVAICEKGWDEVLVKARATHDAAIATCQKVCAR